MTRGSARLALAASGRRATLALAFGRSGRAKVAEMVALRAKAQNGLAGVRRKMQIDVRQNSSAALSAVGLAQALQTATRSPALAMQAKRRACSPGRGPDPERRP